jgi:hypothetical protein
MTLILDRITIVKKGLTGEASVRYNNLSINKLIIDLNSAVNMVSVPKYDGSPVLSGQLMEEIKEQVIYFFNEVLSEADDGVYEFIEEREFGVKKLM